MSEHLGEGLGEVEDPTEQAVGLVAASVLYGMVRAMVDRGATVGAALRLAAFLAVEGAAGRGATEDLGITDRQARRYRAEARSLLADQQLSSDVPAEYVAGWQAVVADRMLWAKEKADADRQG